MLKRFRSYGAIHPLRCVGGSVFDGLSYRGIIADCSLFPWRLRRIIVVEERVFDAGFAFVKCNVDRQMIADALFPIFIDDILNFIGAFSRVVYLSVVTAGYDAACQVVRMFVCQKHLVEWRSRTSIASGSQGRTLIASRAG